MNNSSNHMFKEFAASEINPKWMNYIRREGPLYKRKNDPRNEFNRDYNRILHCLAYRRLKHKTQVFSAPDNDHVCTRIEHVNHVVSISRTIASALGLNEDLTDAIAIGHDLGHAPFGHQGEAVLKEFSNQVLNASFWHEQNSLWFVDNIETLSNEANTQENLNLTYAVRDGLICHCGEVDDNALIPRNELIDLASIEQPGKVQPFSWEGCVVKIADKIAYYGRDAEDAIMLGLISTTSFNNEIYHVLKKYGIDYRIREHLHGDSKEINNTTLIHSFILDLLESSNPDDGLRFSQWYQEFLKSLREVSNKIIYSHPKLEYSRNYVSLVLSSIFKLLSNIQLISFTLDEIEAELKSYPYLKGSFKDWMIKYSDIDETVKREFGYVNKVVYCAQDRKQLIRGIIDFISGMTDNFALKVFDEMIKFR